MTSKELNLKLIESFPEIKDVYFEETSARKTKGHPGLLNAKALVLAMGKMHDRRRKKFWLEKTNGFLNEIGKTQ